MTATASKVQADQMVGSSSKRQLQPYAPWPALTDGLVLGVSIMV